MRPVALLAIAACGWLGAAQEPAPPVPAWLADVTRVAYTDLPNISRYGDWPEVLLADLAKSGVQVFFSRAHSGAQWGGLGWRSRYGDLDPALLGRPVDWELMGCDVTETEAHSGRRCVRLAHTKARDWTYFNRRWTFQKGEQGAMLERLKGEVSFWYRAVQASNARMWLGVVPIGGEGREVSAGRSGWVVPAEHVGDGLWHQTKVTYDYTADPRVKWVHTSCFVNGDSAELLVDDVEYVGTEPQPVTNGGFEELTPDRDGTREVTDLCHRHGMRYLAYYWALREPAALGQQHPEWRCVNRGGKPTAYFCVNTPYRDLVRDRVVELVSEVGVDGVFFDMFHARADECYCAACLARFRQDTGQEAPRQEDFDNPLWQQWLDFQYGSIEAALLDYNRAMKAARPEAALLANTWNAWVYRNSHNVRNSVRVADCVDGVLEETGWYDTVDPSFFAFPALHNFMSWHLAGLSRGRPGFMWSSPSYLGRPLGETEATIRVLAMMTNGAIPAQSVPGRDVLARYMAEVAARDAWFRGGRLYPWCGLVVSEKTELWYGRDNPKDRYVKGVYGAFQALLERHLPVSLVTDRQLERGDIGPLEVLFLPNCAAMSGAELATVRRFVRDGGGLVATYESSWYDERGQPRSEFGLQDLLNATSTGSFDTQTHRVSWEPTQVHRADLRFGREHRWTADAVIAACLDVRGATQPLSARAESVPLNCRMRLVMPPAGADAPLRILTVSANRETGGMDRTDTAGLVESRFGKGRVIYLPADLSGAFFRYGQEYLSRLLELALRDAAAAPPPAEVEAPRIVQAMTHRQGERLVVHLLNDISSLGRSMNVARESLYERREVIPIDHVRVTFREKRFRRFLLVPGEQVLTPVETPDGQQVTVPRLDIHAMVVAE